MCENSSDYYTASLSIKGNKALTYPIGLITADEVMLSGSSGGVFDGTYSYQKPTPNNYLITGQAFLTITPTGGNYAFGYSVWTTGIFRITDRGCFNDGGVEVESGLRPVINIRSDVTVSGDGTMGSPYRFSL